MNAFCLQNMWRYLQQELELVKQELLDCVAMDGWQQHCQVVLRASAGMDYWEFAQFIVMLALPRLQEFESLLQCLDTPISPPAPIAVLQLFIQQVSVHSNKLTFFRAGALPAACRPTADDLEKCLHPERPFVELLSLLPHQLREVVEMAGYKGQVMTSILAFRSVELYTLSSVAEEVSKLLPTLSDS